MRKMLEKIEVYQQPAGFVDNVVFSWMSKNQAKTCVGSVEQRDLFASPLSENGKAVSFLSHQIQTFIAGKMSAALQLTDTHFGFMIKACTRRVKEDIKREMRAEAEAKGQKHPIGFKCGPYEILRISYEAHVHMEQKNEAENTVLAGMRQNFMLSYRPNLRTGKMERCDTQEWCQQAEEEEKTSGRMSEGSHRIQSSWAENRYNWLDEHGRPNPPEWQKCGKEVQAPEDMEDATSNGEAGCKIKLASWEKDEVLKEGVEENCIMIDDVGEDVLGGVESTRFLESVKARRLKVEVDKLLTEQGPKADKEQLKKKDARQKLRAAVRMASEEWRKEQHELMKKFSRKQLLSIFIPSAGHKVKAKPKPEAEKALEKTAKTVLKNQMKSQMKYVKAKLAKGGVLKEALSMSVSDDIQPQVAKGLSAEAKKLEEQKKRSERRRVQMEKKASQKKIDEECSS